MQAANRVVLNTGILYLRMGLTVVISLMSTRLVLNALGSSDFGLFSLIAGIVAMLSFLNTAMATSTQRYLSFHQGTADLAMQRKVFSNSLFLHLCLGLIVVICLESIGSYLVQNFLNIPPERTMAAMKIYHFMSVTIFFTIMAAPFTGTLNAREDMFWLAFVNILEAILKLLIGLSLSMIEYDRLVFYGISTALISVISFIIYAMFCFLKYPECSFRTRTKVDSKLLKELTSFAGWNLFGALCSVSRVQGISILLNLHFGPSINASYGIANQVTSQLNIFSTLMLQALNPQIVKSEGSGDRDRMIRLSVLASKFGFFLLAAIAIPFIFEMPGILKIWLKEVPTRTVSYSTLVLIATIIGQLSMGLSAALQASGKIKLYQLIVGSTILLTVPVGYILLSLGYPSTYVFYAYILFETLACGLRMFFFSKYTGTNVGRLLTTVRYIIVPTALLVIICHLISNIYSTGNVFANLIPGPVVFGITILLFGLTPYERQQLNEIFKKYKLKLA